MEENILMVACLESVSVLLIYLFSLFSFLFFLEKKEEKFIHVITFGSSLNWLSDLVYWGE